MKMETPKMDVVRFEEADVIVASPTPIFTTKVGGFNNETAGDGNIQYKGVTYTDAASLNSALAEDGLSGYYQLYVPGEQTHTLYATQDMFLLDSKAEPGYEHSILIADGDYDWNGNHFVYRQ